MTKPQRWYSRRQLLTHRLSPQLVDWLYDSSSLTARLVSRCGDAFNVRLLSQRWQPINAREAAAMGLTHTRSALIRQVLLCCGETPLVYARTVIPSVTVTGAQRRYANMGRRPLGAMLFADRTMRRERVMVSMLSIDHPVLRQLGLEDAAAENPIWGRRSVFRVSGKPLLVSEFFLPALLGKADR